VSATARMVGKKQDLNFDLYCDWSGRVVLCKKGGDEIGDSPYGTPGLQNL
jgi:hypothetical protein